MAAQLGALERAPAFFVRPILPRSQHNEAGRMAVHESSVICEAHRRHCQASATVPLEKQPLSSYHFPYSHREHRELPSLEAAVRSAISHLPEAPFLQLQQNQLTTHHAIDDEVLQSSQLREGLGGFFRESRAELVMLVRPLSSPDASQSARQVDADGNVMTGIFNASRRQRLDSFSDFLRRGGQASRAVLSGSVGDCCDEESDVTSQVVAFPRKKYSKYQHGQHSHSSRREVTSYYGVILQSRRRGDTGCYVLKTMDSAVGDCTCTHWTLTRVSKDAPVFDQLCSAWLVK